MIDCPDTEMCNIHMWIFVGINSSKYHCFGGHLYQKETKITLSALSFIVAIVKRRTKNYDQPYYWPKTN